MKTSNMNNSTLTITPRPAAGAEPLALSLGGNIDAHAAETLQSLYRLPAGPAELDFAAVQRVNSMGLALLLKLFDHCDKHGVAIKVANANRMVSMLFKMTNMEHYLAESPQPPASPVREPRTAAIGAAREPRMATEVRASTSNLSPAPRPMPPKQEEPKPQATAGKLRFLANMQNSQQLNGWYFFNTYLQKQLGREIHLDLVHAAWDNDLQPATTNLVFAQPFQATQLLLEHGFHLIARPAEQADEITVLVRAEDARSELADFEGARAVTSAAESFVYLLGRFLLDEGGLASDSLSYSFTGHEIKAVRGLLNGEADMLFMQTETYNSLSSLTKNRLRALDASDAGLAFHLFCVSPRHPELASELRSTLLGMSGDGKGQQVLQDLGMTGWSEPEREEIDMLAMLYQRYVGGNRQSARRYA